MKLCIVYCIYVRVSHQLMVRTTAYAAGVDVSPQLMNMEGAIDQR